eukprot:607874-Prorocentrum_minimum.AAC.1
MQGTQTAPPVAAVRPEHPNTPTTPTQAQTASHMHHVRSRASYSRGWNQSQGTREHIPSSEERRSD